MKLGTLICPNCSSALSGSPEADGIVCQYCKTQVFVDRGDQFEELQNVKASSERIEDAVNEVASDVAAIKDVLQKQGRRFATKSAFGKSSSKGTSAPATSERFELSELALPGVAVLFAVYIMYLAGFWWGVFVGSFLGLGLVQVFVPNMALPASMWTTKTKVIGWALMLGLIVPLMVKCA